MNACRVIPFVRCADCRYFRKATQMADYECSVCTERRLRAERCLMEAEDAKAEARVWKKLRSDVAGGLFFVLGFAVVFAVCVFLIRKN